MIEKTFAKIFGKPPEQIAYAPGRVNLIGEHLDYNGGMVMPMALPVGLSVAMRARDDDEIHIASDRFEAIMTRNLSSPMQNDWADYGVGAVIFANEANYLTGGADVFISSTIPDGAGLSSSAALIVAILKAAREIKGAVVSDLDIAVLARRVENEYIGMPCGIMDQMAVAIASQRQAFSLDTKSLSYDLIDLPTDFHMAVVHSGQHRKLSDGRYAERRDQCAAAGEMLGNRDLCLLSDDEFASAGSLSPPLNYRVRHCVREHERAVSPAAALRDNNMEMFGRLMNESHSSMRDDFATSTPEIDALVVDAIGFDELGARLTGAGFGGCIVACVPSLKVQDWKATLLERHPVARYIC